MKLTEKPIKPEELKAAASTNTAAEGTPKPGGRVYPASCYHLVPASSCACDCLFDPDFDCDSDYWEDR